MSRYNTPLRYPGGKQKLTPFIIEILHANDLIGGNYVEPYAGGAGVALELLIGGHVSKVHLNDSSLPVYAFWHSVLNETDALCNLIKTASLTVEEWRKHREIVRQSKPSSMLELGFSTFYLNRCNRSGVLTGGLIGGLEQTGDWKMDARFPRNELIRRIEVISARRGKIKLTNLDAEIFIKTKISKLSDNTLIYCDPPYYEKAKRLYLNSYSDDDHKRLANFIQTNINHKWLVSYDHTPEIDDYYKSRRSFVYDLQYNASRVYKGKELFIFSDNLLIPKESELPYINHALSHISA